LEIIEKKYRDTPESSKKYVKRLTDYINSLLLKGRLLEAKYYFDKLDETKPNSLKTIVLGYKLSIKLFDNYEVERFDKKLFDFNSQGERLFLLRLQYYYSVNNKEKAEENASYLLSKKTLQSKDLQTIYEVCLYQSSYKIALSLSRYMKRLHLKFDEQSEEQLKRIMIKKMIQYMQGLY